MREMRRRNVNKTHTHTRGLRLRSVRSCVCVCVCVQVARVENAPGGDADGWAVPPPATPIDRVHTEPNGTERSVCDDFSYKFSPQRSTELSSEAVFRVITTRRRDVREFCTHTHTRDRAQLV